MNSEIANQWMRCRDCGKRFPEDIAQIQPSNKYTTDLIECSNCGRPTLVIYNHDGSLQAMNGICLCFDGNGAEK